MAFGRVNVKQNNITKYNYNITAYPTILVSKNGMLIDKQIGFHSKSDLVNLIRKSKPELNMSHVNLPAQPRTSTFTGEIPLTKLGVAQPILPMVVNDSNLQFALNKYPLLVLEGYVDWYGFCKKMNGTISMLSADLRGQVAFGLIDAEKKS